MALRYTLLFAAAALYAVVAVFTFVPRYLARRRFKLANGCQPVQRSYPHKDPIFGLDLMRLRFKSAAEHRAMALSQELYQDLETNTFGCHALDLNIISTIEPENVKTILSLKFKDYSLGKRLRAMGVVFGEGIFTTDGEAWAHSRAMIRPNFARDQVADLDAFERHIGNLFTLIPRDGSTVDLQELFFRFTLDSATEFLFGHSTDSLTAHSRGDTDEKNFVWAYNHGLNLVGKRFRWGKLASLMKYSQQDKDAVKIIHGLAEKYVDEAVKYRQAQDSKEAPEDDKYVFIYELAKRTRDKRRLRDELLNVLLAGRDTTAGLLSNMFFFIAKDPKIWQKLRREVEENLRGELPTYEQLRNLKYLRWCINESLRLHPVVPSNSRKAIVDTVLPLGGGPDGRSPLFVPKGGLVAYHPWAMHRRKDFYGEDAEDFKPERWADLRPGWEYLPFNGGPRICIGQQYALTEASYVTVRILQEFKDIQSRDPGPWQEALAVTMSSKNGTKVSLTPA